MNWSVEMIETFFAITAGIMVGGWGTALILGFISAVLNNQRDKHNKKFINEIKYTSFWIGVLLIIEIIGLILLKEYIFVHIIALLSTTAFVGAMNFLMSKSFKKKPKHQD